MKKENKSKEKIKAIVFDVGGVLVEEVGSKISKELSKTFKLNSRRFRKIRIKFYKKSSRGQLTEKEYYQGVSRELKIEEQKIDQFIEHWRSKLYQRTKLKKNFEIMLKKLRKRYILATLTNVSPQYEVPRIKKKVYAPFHIKLSSVEARLLKPHIKFYKLLIKKLKLPPNKILFIDDKIENLLPARRLGMSSILFKNDKQLVRDLRKLGVII